MSSPNCPPPSTIHKPTEVLPIERRRMREMAEDGIPPELIRERYDLPAPTVARIIRGVVER